MARSVIVLGGTRFIGRRIVDELVDAGHRVLVVHRGASEPEGLPDVPHLHADRLALHDVRDELVAFGPDTVLDCTAIGAADSDAVLGALDGLDVHLAVLSSMDVYRAYGSLHAGTVTDAVPLDETSPVRPDRYPYRGQIPGMDDYDKLDVEERWLARNATVLRLPMVYGEHDYQRRQELILRRVRAGRTRIPVGTGSGLFTFGYVGDVARGVRLALEQPEVAAGEVFNLGERRSPPMRLVCERILRAAAADDRVELVRVPDEALPPDLQITADVPQPLLVDSAKARARLGWDDSDADEALRRTVEWHLAHPPPPPAGEEDWGGDDEALSAAR